MKDFVLEAVAASIEERGLCSFSFSQYPEGGLRALVRALFRFQISKTTAAVIRKGLCVRPAFSKTVHLPALAEEAPAAAVF